MKPIVNRELAQHFEDTALALARLEAEIVCLKKLRRKRAAELRRLAEAVADRALALCKGELNATFSEPSPTDRLMQLLDRERAERAQEAA